MITSSTRLALDPRIRFRRFGEEGIVINQKTAEALVLSDVATRLLEMTDGRRTLDECATLLGDEFDADQATIAQDVVRFADDLVEAGIAATV
jgi:Coenzyme PQQ synthesis protein D (PqqD)